MKTIISFTVTKENLERLDKYLTEICPKYSRAFYQQHILAGLVQINGQTNTKVSTRVNFGDLITIDIQEKEEPLELIPEAIPLNKVYEDPMILVINKPRNMVVHPAPGHFHGTLVHALLNEIGERLKEEFPEEPWRPGIVHRLDKDTSGLIITAKTRQAKKVYCELFATKRLKKSYLAICIGKPDVMTIHTSISRHHNKRKEMTVSSQGKEAITHCQVLACNGKLSLVALSPETGRTHQLRVHMKHLGTPILGDPVYGIPSVNHSYGLDKQQLHAYSLDFTHPETLQFCSLTASLPEDMRSLLIKEFQNDKIVLNNKLPELVFK
ncbi:Ribosomal large subunit pseudouridine synthase D,23S rRNA pseudouridine synthase D,pseudouridine synthase, RluA family,RNA pseudouridylate synthase [Chlamydia serpentis]|uniref:Pseudouridine synthase n=1 Tax=Chlamydia serpentis TaxID=1967782 RepID=A0A2R8FC55_9CHLA|nr:RluA family pseudouridine synthase [Chlamydia serpentis]SPN73837.1 Ribosomal large subunit pseudouridine synthase D,23S rRNA pseudouridine synthase D,pseudouridine synthase, RluA family,RNA pseudouridylate synthase [Chlamydia serpentis]